MICSSIRAVTFIAKDAVAVAKWAVSEALDELDAWLTPAHIERGVLAADADDRIRAEASGEAECVEPPELSWGVDGATTDPVTFQEPTGWDVDCLECYPDVPAGGAAVPPASPPAGHLDKSRGST